MAVDTGTGTTITYQSSFFGQIINASYSGWSREVIPTSHMGTTVAHTSQPSKLQQPGQFTVEVLFDPDTNDGAKTAMAAAAETVTVTYPVPSGGMGGATRAASAYMIQEESDIPLEDRMTATYTLQFTGDWSMADST